MADPTEEHQADADGGDATTDAGADGSGGRDREVVVPMRLYKTVTVYATLAAVLLVVLGFTFLDAATGQGGVLLWLARRLPVSVPTPDAGTTRAVFAFAGLATILAGAWVYVMGARFRAEGMGTDKDEGDQPPGDG
jgi:hypothetical protein